MAEHPEQVNFLDPGHLFGHVQDAPYFHVPRFLAPHGHLELPQLRGTAEHPLPVISPTTTDNPVLRSLLQDFDLQFTKFMVIELIAAALLVVVFVRVASRMTRDDAPRGRWANLMETFLLFLRDDVARPAIGHDADRFLPFLWTVFFFVLTCNLLGLVPWLGSPTGALAATGALALITFLVVLSAGMRKLGVGGFWKAQIPHMDIPGSLKFLLIPMIFGIEVMGLLIRHFVLAVRLMANMMAGHLVLAVLIAFIGLVAVYTQSYFHSLFLAVSGSSIVGAALLSLLELLVAFLQAYIFTFLSALFIGMAVHPH
jgi:F-type H+-transporting ATPase subunit a